MRVKEAWEYRKKTVDTSSCRIIFGEADFLPGIVIDKFADVCVVQSLALGIDRLKPVILQALKEVLAENQQLKEQKEKLEGVRKAEAAERIDRLRRQEGELRRLYPDFDWQREMRSERFGRLILAGVEPRTAYETVHGRELMEKAMHYAAGRTRRQVAGSLASGMSRVAENGGRSIAVTASDPRGLTSEDLADIRRRVLDGEKIRF